MSDGAELVSIDCHELKIPFHTVFQHASATRSETEAIWVTARSANGKSGFGEGCPREYVTEESISSALQFITDHSSSLINEVSDLTSLKTWIAQHHEDINKNPAAWCAIELAMLDLFARESKQSIEALLGLPPLSGTFTYTAVIGSSGTKHFSAMFERYKKLGLCDYKIKLSGDIEQDMAAIKTLQQAGLTSPHVRADANNLWSNAEEAENYLRQLDYSFFAIEEPIRAGQYDALSGLANALNIKIILDESIVKIEQLDALASAPNRWIVNLRISKMGGLIRSIELLKCCRKLKIPVIVGAQVGETSLLTRAALTVVHAGRDVVIAQEGAFGTYLLIDDPCKPVLMFGDKGLLETKIDDFSERSGFGLSISSDYL